MGVEAEAVLSGVAVVSAEQMVIHSAEALVQCVAHMGFDPLMSARQVSWFRPQRHPMTRRVRGANETTGRRLGMLRG
jgi:hypothetical protein